MAQLEPMDAVVVRALIDAMRDQTAATRELRSEIRNLADKIDALTGREPEERPTQYASSSAMGSNGR